MNFKSFLKSSAKGVWKDPTATRSDKPPKGKILAAYTDDEGYTIRIVGGTPGGQEHGMGVPRFGTMYVTSPKGRTLQAGYFMNWTEKNYKLTQKEWEKLSWEDRAALEVKQQATRYASLSNEFEFRSKRKN